MENIEFLEGVRLFSELPEAVTRTLAGRMLELWFEKGRRICEENTKGDALFVIKEGIVQIHVGDGPEKKVLAYLKRGDYFGEMAIFSGDPRSASATAIADVCLLGLTKADFEKEVRANPSIALEMLQTLSRRLAKANLRTGKGEDRTGRILFVAGSEPGAGRTSVARELAASLARLSGGRVILFDPNVQNPEVARAAGVDSDCDLARELVATDHITVERYVVETPHGFHVLPPQRSEKSTYPLRESHHHILVNALADKFDYLVVDSSSTMAKLNQHLMQSATRLVAVLSARQEALGSYLEQFLRMTVDVNRVDRRRLLFVLNTNAADLGDPRARLGERAREVSRVLPFDAEAAELCRRRKAPAQVVAPESEWAEGTHQLAREVYLDHSLALFLPLGVACATAEELPEPVASLARRLAKRLEEGFGEAPARTVTEIEEGEDDAVRTVPCLSLAVRTTEERLTEGMDDFLSMATEARDELDCEQLLVKVDGRPSLL